MSETSIGTWFDDKFEVLVSDIHFVEARTDYKGCWAEYVNDHQRNHKLGSLILAVNSVGIKLWTLVTAEGRGMHLSKECVPYLTRGYLETLDRPIDKTSKQNSEEVEKLKQHFKHHNVRFYLEKNGTHSRRVSMHQVTRVDYLREGDTTYEKANAEYQDALLSLGNYGIF